MGPVSGGQHNTFVSEGSHGWNVATLGGQVPVLLGCFFSQSIRSNLSDITFKSNWFSYRGSRGECLKAEE